MATGDILIIDDDPELGSALKEFLETQFYCVTYLSAGKEVIAELKKKSYDLVLLDLVLRDADGFDILKDIRNDYPTLPVIILSGKKQSYNKILGLGLGADDFITKPFEEDELVARVKSHIRRAYIYTHSQRRNVNTKLQFENLQLDLNSIKLTIDNKKFQLNTKLFKLLKIFMEAPEQVFTKEQIYQHIWDDNYFDDNLVMIYISKLRKIIGDSSQKSVYIRNIHGMGYKLTKEGSHLS